MVRIGAVVLNVKDARRASRFWSEALGYRYDNGAFEPERSPVLRPGTGKSPQLVLDESDRTHMDLFTGSESEQAAEVERLLGLGATRVDWTYPDGAGFVVLADPEGNLFCVVVTRNP